MNQLGSRRGGYLTPLSEEREPTHKSEERRRKTENISIFPTYPAAFFPIRHGPRLSISHLDTRRTENQLGSRRRGGRPRISECIRLCRWVRCLHRTKPGRLPYRCFRRTVAWCRAFHPHNSCTSIPTLSCRRMGLPSGYRSPPLGKRI